MSLRLDFGCKVFTLLNLPIQELIYEKFFRCSRTLFEAYSDYPRSIAHRLWIPSWWFHRTMHCERFPSMGEQPKRPMYSNHSTLQLESCSRTRWRNSGFNQNKLQDDGCIVKNRPEFKRFPFIKVTSFIIIKIAFQISALYHFTVLTV